jgi:hypothetical protein
MDQSTYIVGTIIAGFVIYITVRGELPRYMGFLYGAPKGNAQASNQPLATVTETGGNASGATPSSPGGSFASDALAGIEIAGAIL